MTAADMRSLACDESIRHTGGPYFHIMNEHSTVKLFLDAVAKNADEAKRFISKNCIKTIDLSELKNCFEHGGYKYLTPASAVNGHCRTNTVLIFNRAQNVKIVLRLYMIREPDQFGQWKIVNFERE
jgi:hypothetical protein